MESQNAFSRVFSLEFFPPKNEAAAESLQQTRAELAKLKPAYISVTFGAGGSTQQGTLETVLDIQQSGTKAAPHISCITSSKDELRQLLNTYQQNGIDRIVTLRGDLPSGAHGSMGELRYANELVAFIRQETGDHFHIEVAAYPEFHPQSRDASSDLDNFKRKVEAGANSALTQYFYNADAYFSFVEACEDRGMSIPVIPGIMPITNYKQLARFSDMCGAEIPRWIKWRLQDYGDDLASLKAFGYDVTLSLCQRLLDGGAPGLHFYSMNRIEPTKQLWQDLNL